MLKLIPDYFFPQERIVRFIYSTQQFNPNTRKLKANFVRFDFNSKTNKNELSCLRFEFETLENCRVIGNSNNRPNYDAVYYGMGCISVQRILEDSNYSIRFTPILDRNPKNKFHCDIYFLANEVVAGQASSASENLQRSIFVEKWNACIDNPELSNKSMVFYNN